MNREIGHLFGLVVLLFAVLVVFTSRWTVFEQKSLEQQTANRRPLLEQQRVPRGLIYASDGSMLARSNKLGSGATLRYVRTYPQNGLFAHALGYSFITQGSAGLEKSENDALTGSGNEFKSIIDELAGQKQEGDDLRTTLDPAAQRAALQSLGGRRGAVVAIEPSTGKVRVMANVPSYDPNQVPTDLKRLNTDSASPLFDRATQARYPPGSTFKVVTTVAGIDSGSYTPGSTISGKNNKVISGVPLQNFGGEDFGPISLTTALTHSVNTVFGEVGEKVGKATMYKYMERFGFDTEPPIDLPPAELTPSGVYGKGGKLLKKGDAVDIGRVAIGQERLQVTPMQMAMVAAAIANGGKLMKPRLVDRVVARDGRVKSRVSPAEVDRVMSASTAQQVGQMMSQVVKEGTGTQAALQGISVAGKTGTAEVAGGSANQAWFIAFAPVNNPRMAIAATVERTQGEGGTVAAPIAKRVLQVLLHGG